MEKINILFVIIQMKMGGTERLVHNIALNIDRKFFNPSILWFFGQTPLKEFKDLRIPLYHVPKTQRFDFVAMRKLSNIIRNNNIQVVNAHHFMSMVYSFYGCKIKNNRKLIYTEHSKWEVEQISFKWRIIGCYLMKKLNAVVGINNLVADSLQNKFKIKHQKVYTIKNGVDLNRFSKKNRFLKRELNIPNNIAVIGIVANFRKVKNHIFLLKAFKNLLKEYKNVKLLFIGQGFKGDKENSEHEIKHFIEDNQLNNNVLLLGFRADIANLLNIMDIFCLSSFKEGLPISLIEAMAAGLPVVGTDVEGIRDIIINGKNGFLVQIDDVKGLKNALYTLLNDESLRQKMGRESKSLANQAYSLDYCINQYQDLFMSIMNK